MKQILQKMKQYVLVVLLVVMGNYGWGQTYYDMSSGNYIQNFDAITSLPTNFSTVGVLSTGSIPVATKTTTASTGALSVVSSGAAVGIDVSPSTRLTFLTTGSADNSSAIAVDLNLNFSSSTAGMLSYTASTIFNSSGNRASSLRVYYSINGTSWAELSGTNLPYVATNNIVGSGTVSISLPSELNNQPNVKLRFYYHNGSGGSTGSRPRIGIDNLTITSTPFITNAVPVASSVNITGTPNIGQLLTGTYTYTDVDSDLEGTSTFQWYRADNASGLNSAAISGATSNTYTLQVADDGKYIRFGVVPVAETGTSPGQEAFSSWKGPVANNSIAAPQSNAASGVGATSFTANWDAVPGATGYEIDVYKINLTSNTTTETFTSIGGGTSTSYFTRAWTGTDNITWTAYKSRTDQVIFSGNDALTLRDESGSYLESGEITGNPTNITFDLKQSFTGSGGAITLSILHGASFGTTTQIGIYPYTTSTQNIVAPISGIMGPFKVVLSNNAAARPTIDNLAITKLTESTTYISQNQNVGNVTSYQVTGLDQNTTYYYVVRAKDATSESVNSNEITTTTAIVSTTYTTSWSNSAPTASIDAIINGNLTTTTDLVCKDLTINSGKTLTIAAGTTLTVSNNLVNNGSIVFKSNNTSTGRFGPYNGSATLGSVTMERYIDGKRAFRFLAPGVTTSGTIADNWQEQVFITGSTTGANGFDTTVTGAPSMFTYENSGWAPISNTDVLTLNAQKGYRILIRGDRTPSILTSPSNGTMNNPVTLTATGTMITGDVPYNTLTNQDYTLVANPYISPINWATVTKNNISDTYYAWDPNLGTGNQRGRYVSCDVAGNTSIISGTGSPSTDVDQFIQPGQAVFIQKTTSGVNGSVTIKETDKAATFTDVFRTPNNSSNAINGKLGVNLYESLAYSLGEYPIDGAVVVSGTTFNTNSASDDTKKIMSHGEQVAFVRDNIQLGIEKISAPQENDELSIACINLVPNKNYVWSVVLQDGFSNEDAYLYDAFTQMYHPLTGNSVISFNTTDDVNSSLVNRFKIVFQNAVLSNATFQNTLTIYPNPAKAGASFYVEGISEATVTVSNLLGQTVPVQTKSQGTTLQVTPNTNLSQGVYLVNITTQGNTQQIKWIVE
jgi:hypothetical protein